MTSRGEGELCRVALLEHWLAANTTNLTEVRSLRAIQETPAYEEIASDCRDYMDAFDEAAGITCLKQRDGGLTYSDFWQIGPINMNANWSVAFNMKFTNNFTDAANGIPCANSCYTKRGGVPGCEIGTAFGLENLGKVAQERVCELGWSDLDDTYNNLRVCAATSLRAGSVVVGAYEQQALTQKACSDAACQRQVAPASVASSPSQGCSQLFFIVGAIAVIFGK